MTSVVDSAIEFRCRSCWQQVYASIVDAGSSIPCPHCESATPVPQASEENLCSAEKLAEQSQLSVESEEELGDEELAQLVAQENACALGDMIFAGHAKASLMSRFIAAMLDGLYNVFLAMLGIGALVVAHRFGIFGSATMAELAESIPPEAYLIFYFPMLLGQIIQWNLIATRGQSIGKIVCCIRIVTTSGKLPGFVRGVVLRNWVTYALGSIPFFSLIDIAFIFTESQRCVHDYLADTRVIQA